jgi:hypothetical protein
MFLLLSLVALLHLDPLDQRLQAKTNSDCFRWW